MRIGILFGGDEATEMEAMLIGELNRLLPQVQILIFTNGDPTAQGSWAERLRRQVDARISRDPDREIPFASLAGPSLEVASLAGRRDVVTAIAGKQCDVLIDLGSSLAGRELSQASPRVYQLWCDERRDTFRFGALIDAPRDRRLRLFWTARTPDQPWPTIAAESSLLWTPATVLYNRDRAAGRALALLMRTLRAARGRPAGAPWRGDEARRAPTARQSLMATADAVTDALARRAARVWMRRDVWFIAYRPLQSGREPAAYRRWGTDRNRWVADPFVFDHDGSDYLFFEDFPYATNRGVISWTKLLADGSLAPPELALERDYHLSYPFVFEDHGNIYMIPESAESRRVELYRAVDFPRRWELAATLLENVNAVDATLHFDGERWWMFVNIGEYDSSTWDELFLFSAETLLGAWRPHPQNPVKTDPASSRPAGRLFYRDGRLIRPTQDCSVRYGGGVTLCEVDRLDELHFEERVVDTIGPEALAGTRGVHTLNRTEGLEVLDGNLGSRPIWWPGYPRAHGRR